MADTPKYRLPLPKRFNAAMSEEAYANLRRLAEQTGLSNNYVLTAVFENAGSLIDEDDLRRAAAAMLERARVK